MTAIYRLGGSQSAATITRGHTHTKFDPINSAVDTLTHVVDLLLHSQVKSQVEAVKLVDHISLDVIDLNGEQYQNMRFGNNLAESMAFGYQFMGEHLSQFQRDHQVLPRWTERRWWRRLPVLDAAVQGGDPLAMMPPTVRRSL